jgi:hypothetical protein
MFSGVTVDGSGSPARAVLLLGPSRLKSATDGALMLGPAEEASLGAVEGPSLLVSFWAFRLGAVGLLVGAASALCWPA